MIKYVCQFPDTYNYHRYIFYKILVSGNITLRAIKENRQTQNSLLISTCTERNQQLWHTELACISLLLYLTLFFPLPTFQTSRHSRCQMAHSSVLPLQLNINVLVSIQFSLSSLIPPQVSISWRLLDQTEYMHADVLK